MGMEKLQKFQLGIPKIMHVRSKKTRVLNIYLNISHTFLFLYISSKKGGATYTQVYVK